MNAHSNVVSAFGVGPVAATVELPHSVEMEQEVLGAILINPEVIGQLASFLKADHFSEEIHRRIYDVASEMHSAGKPVSIVTLKPFLGEHQVGDMTIGQYLARLCANASTVIQAPGYARIISDLAARREMIDAADDLRRQAFLAGHSTEASSIASDAITSLQKVINAQARDAMRKIGDVAFDLLDRSEQLFAGAIESEAVTTGYRGLDDATGGYGPGELWVVAGRPGMGKSIYMNASARRCAQKGAGVLEFPLEIGPDQLTARHLADLTYNNRDPIPFGHIGRRGLNESQIHRLKSGRERLSELSIEIDGRARLTIAQIAAKVRLVKQAMSKKGQKLKVAFLDHLDYIIASDRYSGNRTQEIGEICIGLKEIARSEHVCVVLLCQLNRASEQRSIQDRRPALADLRNSGDIEQVADVVMFAYRPEYYLVRTAEYLNGDPNAAEAAADARGKFEAILAKVRSGPTPTVHLFCDPLASTLSSIAM